MPEDPELGGLAAGLAASLDDVRGCLLVSADGMTLDVFPEEREGDVREVWDRLRSIGDLRTSFLAIGGEVWALARLGEYAGVVVAGPTATPGLVLDQLEFTLRSVEVRLGEATSATRWEDTGRPKAPRRPERKETAQAPPRLQAAPSDGGAGRTGFDLSDPVRVAQEFVSRILGTGGTGNGKRHAASASTESPEETRTVRDAPTEALAHASQGISGPGEDAPEARVEAPVADETPPKVPAPGPEEGDVDPVALVWEFRDLASE